MQSIFKRKKSPDQLIKSLKEALEDPNGRISRNEEEEDSVTKRLHQIKILLYGEV